MPIARRVAVVALAVAVPLLLAAFLVANGGRAAASGDGGVETIVVTVPSSTPPPTTTQAGSGTGSGPGGLVFTGADVVWPVLAGLALLGAGTLFAMAGKRRRRAQ